MSLAVLRLALGLGMLILIVLQWCLGHQDPAKGQKGAGSLVPLEVGSLMPVEIGSLVPLYFSRQFGV